MTLNKRDHWLELRGGLLQLIEDLGEHLNKTDKDTLCDFIESREYGVALEWLFSIATDRCLILSLEQKTTFAHLGHLMGIDLIPSK